MKYPVLVLMFAAVLSVTGCVSAPTPATSSVPWVPPAKERKEDKVWQDVRAGKTDLSGQPTLAELTDIALKNNPASSKAWNDARMAAEQVTYAQGYFLPEIKAVASGMKQRTKAAPATFDVDYMKYGPGLQVNYLIINFGGGRRAAVEQALQTVYAADYVFNRTLQDIILAVETAYYGVISAKAGVEAAEANVKDAEKTLEVARERLKQGVGTELETLQAKAGYDQSLYNKANAEGLCKIARGALARAIGVPADTEIQPAPPAGEVPELPGALDMRKLVDESIQRRPDIAALRATMSAKEAAVRVARAAYWPSLFLNGSLDQSYFDTEIEKQFQDDDWSYNGVLSLQWTLYDGLQNVSEKRIAVADAASARAQLRQAELAASADVWTRYHNYETAVQKYKFSVTYLESASAAYNLAMDSYKAQLIDILDLLNAETQLAQARMQNVATRQDVFAALANLAYSMGLLEKGGSAQAGRLFQK
jgi:outer membrane protein TolC